MRAAHTIAYLPLYCQLWNFATKLEIFVFSRRLSVLKISSHCSGQTQLKAGIIYPISDKKLFIRNFKTASCLAVAFSAQIHKTLKFLIQNKNELKFKSCVIIQQQFSPNSIQWATLRYSIKDGRCSSDREWSILNTVSICARSSLVQLRHHKFEMR